jgi:hypothetical protein
MRLKSGIWVRAYLRACAAAGAPAVVVRRGDDDAGAIFIKIARLDGTARLFGPAPAGFEPEDGDGDRRWMPVIDGEGASDAAVDAYLVRQVAFDSDAWVLEVEDRAGRHFLEAWLASPAP